METEGDFERKWTLYQWLMEQPNYVASYYMSTFHETRAKLLLMERHMAYADFLLRQQEQEECRYSHTPSQTSSMCLPPSTDTGKLSLSI